MLIEPEALLAFDPWLPGSYVTHACDFHKPDLTSEHPVVDGLSYTQSRCYTVTLDVCSMTHTAWRKLREDQVNGYVSDVSHFSSND